MCGRFVNRPYGEMWVCIVGAGITLPVVGHRRRFAGG